MGEFKNQSDLFFPVFIVNNTLFSQFRNWSGQFSIFLLLIIQTIFIWTSSIEFITLGPVSLTWTKSIKKVTGNYNIRHTVEGEVDVWGRVNKFHHFYDKHIKWRNSVGNLIILLNKYVTRLVVVLSRTFQSMLLSGILYNTAPFVLKM